MTKPCATGLSFDELTALFATWGEPEYRARQVWHWLHRRLAASADAMINLPKSLRAKLEDGMDFTGSSVIDTVTSADGLTTKRLLKLADGNTIESVLMSFGRDPARRRHTVCVSSQVGCPIACPFCATGRQGFQRNLTPAEIIDQVLQFARLVQDMVDTQPPYIDNVVFMGMGEPLLNYNAVWKAIGILNSLHGFGLGARGITISTSGVVPSIERLSKETLQVGLAVSLHAANNRLRNELVPLNRKYPLEELIPACRAYVERTGRRVTFEYVLLQGLNDSAAVAAELASLLKGLNCYVNLIRANPGGWGEYHPPPPAGVDSFKAELRRYGVNCTVRQSVGADIQGGCGQLRSGHLAADAT